MRFLLLLLMFVPSVLTAQRWEVSLEHQMVKMADSVGSPDLVRRNNQLNLWFYTIKRVGFWSFGYEEDSTYSGVAGLYADITSWFQLSLGAGVDGRKDAGLTGNRYASSILLWREKTCSLELYYERGRTTEDHWYQGDLFCEPVDGFGVGIFSQRFAGTGPRFLLGISHKVPLKVWVSPFMYDFESESSSQALGVQLVFRGRK